MVFERNATSLQRADIVQAFANLCAELRAKGYTTAGDEHAATLMGAITRYIVESQQ